MADAPNNVKKLVTALITPFATLEAALLALLTQRGVDTAIGAQLDVLGKIVGQARNGLDDDDYRRYVRARISANRSQGVAEDLIKVAVLVLGNLAATIAVGTEGIATTYVNVTGITVTDGIANILLEFLQDAVSAGVRPILGTKYVTDDLSFATAPLSGQTYTQGAITSGATSFQVLSTAGFPGSGSVDLDFGTNAETVAYTSTDATHFLGVTGLAYNHVSATTVLQHGLTGIGQGFPLVATIAAAVSIGAVAVQVDSTAGFPNNGSLVLESGNLNQETITYTSKNSTFFLGCSALTKTHAVSRAVEPSPTVGGQLMSARDADYTVPVL